MADAEPWDLAAIAPEGRGPSRVERLGWSAAITWAGYDYARTGSLLAPAFLACLIFGREPIRMAGWLLGVDPDRRRGRIGSMFYLAWGIGRIALMAFAILFAWVVIGANRDKSSGGGPGVAAPTPEFEAMMTLGLLGLLISGSISALVAASVFRRPIKVWVGPEVAWAWQDGVWPPSAARKRRSTRNRARLILVGGLIAGGLPPISAIIMVALGRRESIGLTLALTFAIIVGAPVAILSLMDRFNRTVIAADPRECWPLGLD